MSFCVASDRQKVRGRLNGSQVIGKSVSQVNGEIEDGFINGTFCGVSSKDMLLCEVDGAPLAQRLSIRLTDLKLKPSGCV